MVFLFGLIALLMYLWGAWKHPMAPSRLIHKLESETLGSGIVCSVACADMTGSVSMLLSLTDKMHSP